MKGVFIFLTIVTCCHSSPLWADVRSPETNGTTEFLLVTVNGVVSVINIAGTAAGAPLRWATGLGIASGLTAVIYTLTSENLEYPTALPVAGLAFVVDF
jgi:hypothetical protein